MPISRDMARLNHITRYATGSMLLWSAAILLVALFVFGDLAHASAIPRATVMSRAMRWVELEVPYSQARSFEGYRTDCSGYVSMSWALTDSVGRPMSPATNLLPYQANLISKNRLLPGDMIVRPKTATTTGHAVIFGGWADDLRMTYWCYEQSGSAGGTRMQKTPYPYWPSSSGEFLPYRYKNIVDTPDLTNLNVYPSPVTPNGDGWADWTYFNYTLNNRSTIDIKIYDVAWNLMAVPAEGVSQGAGFYSYRYNLAGRGGTRLPDGVYWYSVQARNQAGTQHRGGMFFVSGNLGTAPALGTSPRLSKVWMHPNPFFPAGGGADATTSFCYTVRADAFVTIKVFDYRGEVKTVLNNARRNKGRHYEGWNGKDDAGRSLPPGNYRYYIFATGGGTSPHTHLATGVTAIR